MCVCVFEVMRGENLKKKKKKKKKKKGISMNNKKKCLYTTRFTWAYPAGSPRPCTSSSAR